jgi:hypothetical protein
MLSGMNLAAAHHLAEVEPAQKLAPTSPFPFQLDQEVGGPYRPLSQTPPRFPRRHEWAP